MTYDHADMSRLSYSGAKILLEPGGPEKYLTAMTSPREERREFDVGTAAHSKILGVGQPYVEITADGRTKEGIAQRAAAKEVGAIGLSSKDFAVVNGMAEAVLRQPKARKLLEGAEVEKVVHWDHHDGTPMRGMFDAYRPDLGLVVDLKTARDADTDGFSKAIWNYRYDIQVGAYIDAAEDITDSLHEFVWIVVEKAAPYLCAVYQADYTILASGRAGLDAAATIWRECRESGVWPGLPDDITTITLPRWARTEAAA
jgi:hypothetical protein